MKKWIITIAVAAVITTVALASDSISSTQASQPGEKQETAEKKMITLQEAKEIALEEVDGVVKSIELSRDDNRYYYEVDIHDGTFEYELDIDAFSGEILDFEKDSDKENIKKLDSLLSMDEAIVIAQKEAPNASLVEVEIDRDDNRILFEIKMRDDEYNYEIDVNASTGEIVDIDKDRNEKAAKKKETETKNKETASKEKEVEKIELAPAPKAEKKQEKKAAPKAEPKKEKKAAPKQEKKQEKKAAPKQEKKPEKKQEKKQEEKKSTSITMDQAIAIAKQHGSGVVTDVERDDGVWEIEMEDGDIEYEIEIHVRTGEVVSFEKDIDD